ncbi:DsbA family protein [Haloarcula sp. Atlit-120R]|uniref:DsbA family oxidoreductase n=1 Tax=Haloarcula sp. Atlit-120R TaxID=2282135 RepID=UPI000EF289A1|nr:DsbA family protein [Haloarcula sp. Atlit-120R]RLM32878.1 hypothetical protein DVK01_19510 [Haloarcula sp. Atlit-120R]
MSQRIDEQPPPRTLILFSDYACPLSYLAKEAMEQYAEWAIFPVDTDYRLFDLYNYIRSPSGDLDRDIDLADEQYFTEVQESAKVLNEQLKLVDTLQSPGFVDSYNAHKAAFFVKKEYPEEVFKHFHEKILQARWREGRDISQPDVLRSIGSSTGVSSGEIQTALDDSELGEELDTLFKKRQRTRRPISPTTVYQELSVHGVVPSQTISQLVDAGQGHPGDEMGARWFRYREYFNV